MKAAQIELTNYFVSELHFTANQAYKAGLPSAVRAADLEVVAEPSPKPNDRREWMLSLRVELKAPEERNSPYTFKLEMIGFYRVAPELSEDRIDRHVKINAPSVLFGAAREVVRAATSRGPYPALLLPAVTFWEPKPQPVLGEKAPVRGEVSTVEEGTAETLPKPRIRKRPKAASPDVSPS